KKVSRQSIYNGFCKKYSVSACLTSTRDVVFTIDGDVLRCVSGATKHVVESFALVAEDIKISLGVLIVDERVNTLITTL
ncbi:unnamed protein product, partial [Rotaria socialis]